MIDRSAFPQTVTAAQLRHVLRLTPHQLGDLTARLAIDVGDRPNYPRYRYADHQLLVSLQALRELRMPLDGAAEAAVAYQDVITAGQGWLLASPDTEKWTVLAARSTSSVMSHLTHMGHLAILDLKSLQRRARRLWTDMTVGHLDG